MDIKKIAVIGAGTMVTGIAHVSAQHCYDVVL
ncbi:MAG: 3-hydroxyacyl-CoA dehydrogenase NAD-binding domain-containing protein, partial [bacterium]